MRALLNRIVIRVALLRLKAYQSAQTAPAALRRADSNLIVGALSDERRGSDRSDNGTELADVLSPPVERRSHLFDVGRTVVDSGDAADLAALPILDALDDVREDTCLSHPRCHRAA